MTGKESENFYKTDDRRYILLENDEFIKWYSEIKKDLGFTSIIGIKGMQDLINKIVMFYEFKYPSEMFDSFSNVTKA